MKKLLPLLLCLLLLCGCAATNIQQVTLDGQEMTVNLDAKTITHGADVYTYEQKDFGVTEKLVTVRYPDGVTYQKAFTFGIIVGGNTSTGGTLIPEDSGTYTGEPDESRYLPGLLVAKAVIQAQTMQEKQEKAKEKDGLYLIVGIILLLAGLVALLFPETGWYMNHWWCVEDGKPSELYLNGSRFSGIIGIAIGIILLLIAIF